MTRLCSLSAFLVVVTISFSMQPGVFFENVLLGQEASDDAATDGPVGFAVVELFTSQGCSSCPPADQVLAEQLKFAAEKKLPVYCLSFHVDYWDRLGWTDPYGKLKFSKRQREYARAIGNNRVYTPQMIVNGRYGFVGSNKTLANKALGLALQQRPSVSIELSATSTVTETDQRPNVEVAWKIVPAESDQESNLKPGKLRINLALVQKSNSNEVPRGENSGETLSHVNIVREHASFTIRKKFDGSESIAIPAGLSTDDCRVIAWVQDSKSLSVMAGQKCEINASTND